MWISRKLTKTQRLLCDEEVLAAMCPNRTMNVPEIAHQINRHRSRLLDVHGPFAADDVFRSLQRLCQNQQVKKINGGGCCLYEIVNGDL